MYRYLNSLLSEIVHIRIVIEVMEKMIHAIEELIWLLDIRVDEGWHAEAGIAPILMYLLGLTDEHLLLVVLLLSLKCL